MYRHLRRKHIHSLPFIFFHEGGQRKAWSVVCRVGLRISPSISRLIISTDMQRKRICDGEVVAAWAKWISFEVWSFSDLLCVYFFRRYSIALGHVLYSISQHFFEVWSILPLQVLCCNFPLQRTPLQKNTWRLHIGNSLTHNEDMIAGLKCLCLYRVIHLLWDLGWFDLDYRCSTVSCLPNPTWADGNLAEASG